MSALLRFEQPGLGTPNKEESVNFPYHLFQNCLADVSDIPKGGLSTSGHVRPRQATEIGNFGEFFSTGFFEFSPVDSFLFLQVFRVIK